MRRSYLFIYSDPVGSRDALTKFFDDRPEILYWRHDLPNTYYLISENTADELARMVQRFNHERGRFLICEVGANKEGWLPRATWILLNSTYPEPQ